MIKLGYLEGYNSFNVPSFASKQARDTYFNNITGLVEIDAYYPPLYTNVIKLDITQVSQSVPYNFVILVHNSEYYYYFIDDIKYINEELYEIYINMDTILTYMFDIKITNGLINRKSIKRWNSTGEINREYIRENLSEGIFDVDSYTYKNPNKYIIVTTSSHYGNEGDDYRKATYNINNTSYSLGYYVFIIPIPSNLNNIYSSQALVALRKTGHTDISVSNPADCINFFIDNPYVINMTYVESEYLDRLLNTSWQYVGLNNLICNINYPSEESIVKFNGSQQCCIAISTFPSNIDTSNYNLYVNNKLIGIKNTTINRPFDFDCIPQIIDENYIQLKYGNITGFTSYPMHQSKSGVFKTYDITDVTTGNQGYYILDKNDDINKYNTFIFTTSTNFDLITDAWKQYQAQNKGTLSTGLQLQGVNTLYNTVKGVALPIASNKFYMARSEQYFEKDMQSMSDAYANRAYSSRQQAVGGLSGGLMQGINVIANYKANKENLEFTPDTIKGRNSMLSMAFSKYLSPYIEVSCCKDIMACAKRLEEFGYKVNEVLQNSNGILINAINNVRYYYNCIGVNITSYKLLRFISNDLLNNFIERLSNNIRLFNISILTTNNLNMSSCLQYDNVETEEIISV